MSERIWHKGPPPHVGWWLTDRSDSFAYVGKWRWWNGSAWSVYCEEGESAKGAAEWVKWSSFPYSTREILWSDYWPENARVPRIDPRKA